MTRKEKQLDRLWLYLHYKVVSEECGFCENVFESDYDENSLVETAKEMYKLGWREVSSEKYQMIALACPDCAKKKDTKR